MTPEEADAREQRFALLHAENAELRGRLASAERYVAQTLARATRLSQVISVLARDADFDSVVERAAVEVGELFSGDVALLMVGADDAVSVKGQYGIAVQDIPGGPFPLAPPARLTVGAPVLTGAVNDVGAPDWMGKYGLQHVAWARLLVGEESLGVLLLGRMGPEPFEPSDEKELRAVAYRVALAMENGLLHRRMSDQLAQLSRIQSLTAQLAGTLELEPVCRHVAAMLMSETPATACVVLLDRDGALDAVASCGEPADEDPVERFLLETAGKPVGCVDVVAAPAEGSEARDVLLHLLGIAALAIDKALLHELSREQARRDSLTGLLGHRVFHERLDELAAGDAPFSVVLLDIDDFKQVNDRHGHGTGDAALRLVADALRRGVRGCDDVFRIGGEEFCAVLPDLGHDDAFRVAERLRISVSRIPSAIPVTVSAGVASFPLHSARRDEIVGQADAALYASKRSGKNRTSLAGAELAQPA